jgi:hypothetical protein
MFIPSASASTVPFYLSSESEDSLGLPRFTVTIKQTNQEIHDYGGFRQEDVRGEASVSREERRRRRKEKKRRSVGEKKRRAEKRREEKRREEKRRREKEK